MFFCILIFFIFCRFMQVVGFFSVLFFLLVAPDWLIVLGGLCGMLFSWFLLAVAGVC